MLNKIIIYATSSEIHTFAYSHRLEYYLIDADSCLNQAVFYAKVVNLFSKNGIAWVNYIADQTGIINLAQKSLLQQGSRLLCQMNWEGDSEKKAKLSTEIKLAGKYVVVLDSKLHHFARGLKDTAKLAQISNKNQHIGLIFRSAINNLADLSFVEAEIEILAPRLSLIKQGNFSAPQQLSPGIPKYMELLHNCSGDYSVITNSDAIFNQLKPYVDIWQIEQLTLDENLFAGGMPKVSAETKHESGIHLHKLSGINLIDVDSNNSQLSFFQVNYLAVDEIVHQIKLNDLYGIILIDFIKNMGVPEQGRINEKLGKLLKDDWRRNKVLGFSNAGICEIIRSK